jgi:hypothetical protein
MALAVQIGNIRVGRIQAFQQAIAPTSKKLEIQLLYNPERPKRAL